MKYRLLLPLALAACYLACDSANPVAPGGTSLTIIANPTLIALSGEAATITVTGFRPDGNPLFPGTQVRLTTDLGTLDSDLLEIGSGGRAQTQLRGDGQPGPATVQAFIATSGGGGGGGGDGMGGGTGGGTGTASVVVQIGDDDTTRPTIALTASPSTAALGEQVQVIATLRNADGSIFTGGGNVLFETSLGTLSQTSAPVGGDGRATTTLSVGDQVGTAVVTASFGSATPATIDVTVENQRPTLVVTVNPDDISVNQDAVVTILARDINGNPIVGEDVQLFATLGGFPDDPNTTATTGTDGIARATYNGGERAGGAQITAILGTSDPVTATVQIRDVVGNFVFEVDPTAIDTPAQGGTGEQIVLTGRVQNPLGQPIANVTISFFSSVGGAFTTVGGQPTNSNVTTNTGGVAQVVLTVTNQQVPAGTMSFTVSGTVVAETAPGVAREIVTTITVRPP